MISVRYPGLRAVALLVLIMASSCGHRSTPESGPDSTTRAIAKEQAFPTGLPAIGKWMIAPDSAPAHWLNEIYLGKHLREPINVIIMDSAATSIGSARERLLAALANAGFPARLGHSSGYSAIIGDTVRAQLMDGSSGTFADEPFEFNNDHGRIFGPYLYNGACVWSAAFSREKIAPFAQVRHEYVSFKQGRDAFATGMAGKTSFKRVGFVRLDNNLLDHPTLTTGDHDGTAVLLVNSK